MGAVTSNTYATRYEEIAVLEDIKQLIHSGVYENEHIDKNFKNINSAHLNAEHRHGEFLFAVDLIYTSHLRRETGKLLVDIFAMKKPPSMLPKKYLEHLSKELKSANSELNYILVKAKKAVLSPAAITYTEIELVKTIENKYRINIQKYVQYAFVNKEDCCISSQNNIGVGDIETEISEKNTIQSAVANFKKLIDMYF